jgi:hypothetical protein
MPTDPNWKLRGTGDIDNDDNSDLVFRYQAAGGLAGQTMVWFMDGTNIRSQTVIGVTETDLNWFITGVADMDGDGYQDIVLRNYSTGENRVWLIQPTGLGVVQLKATQILESEPNVNWLLVGVGDYNSDGFNDILWHNGLSGETRIWLMNRVSHASTVITLPSVIDQTWQIAGPR